MTGTLYNGPAEGISITIMGLFGLIYAWDKATFHTPFMELGQSPEGCSSFMFPRIMGPAKVHWLASNSCWNLCITLVKEHISSYCEFVKLHHYFFVFFSPMKCCLLEGYWQQLKQETVDWLQMFYPMTSLQKKFRTLQAMAKLPPQGRKLNYRISQQGALYNGVAVAFGDMLFEGGGGGGGRGLFVIS